MHCNIPASYAVHSVTADSALRPKLYALVERRRCIGILFDTYQNICIHPRRAGLTTPNILHGSLMVKYTLAQVPGNYAHLFG